MRLLELVLNKRKIIHCVFLISYCFFILWITVLNRNTTVSKYELGLFWGLRKFLNNEPNGYTVFVQYINNILFFIPFGFLFCESFGLKLKQILIAGLIASACVEITQYITARGLTEIDDVISNTAGTGIGFLVWKIKTKIMERYVNVR